MEDNKIVAANMLPKAFFCNFTTAIKAHVHQKFESCLCSLALFIESFLVHIL